MWSTVQNRRGGGALSFCGTRPPWPVGPLCTALPTPLPSCNMPSYNVTNRSLFSAVAYTVMLCEVHCPSVNLLCWFLAVEAISDCANAIPMQKLVKHDELMQIILFTDNTPRIGVSRYLNLLSRQKSTFPPGGENYELDRKIIHTFNMGTTWSITVQSLGNIVQCTHAVVAKIWCLSAKWQPAGIVFIQ